MTKRDFFIIVIRIIGLYGFLHSLLILVSQMIFLVPYPNKPENIYSVLSTVLYSIVWILPIIYSATLVKLLGLEKDFDNDDIRLGNIDTRKLLVFAIVLVAGITIVDSLAEVFYHATLLFKYSVDSDYKLFDENKTTYWLIVNAIKFGVGMLLLTNYDRLAGKLMIKDRNL